MNVVKAKALLPKDFTLCALFNYAVYRNMGEKSQDTCRLSFC